MAPEVWPDESRRVLDATTLRTPTEIEYPFAASSEPVPPGGGTWMTVATTRAAEGASESHPVDF
ncbi:hypothetical protein ABZZ36_07415 [Actinacidiphila glaucinigra]|uniref:hypothetical protein n=1 Tax=Actinacidiphila glaucinigra TaxID=235986 RepID=UPI0033B8FFE8